MRPRCYSLAALLLAAGALILAPPVLAQYGTGEVVQVQHATSPIVLDGSGDDPDWETATFIDLVQVYEAWGEFGDPENPNVIANARLLWRDDVLYVLMYVEQLGHELFFNPGPNWWEGTSAIVGIDLTHAGDDQIDDSWGGWPDNAPNLGPVTYKISAEHPQTFTLNWGFDEAPNPIDAGYIDGVLVVHEDNFAYTVEMAIYGEEISAGAQVGFNAAGSIGSDPPGEEWGWFAYSVCELDANCQWAGGLMTDARGYISLEFLAPEEGAYVQVPQATGPITLDGQADEAAWEDAAEVSLTEFWNSGYYEGWGDPDTPDLTSTARLLWDDDVLYVFIHSEHAVPMLFDPPSDDPWDSNQIFVGVDLTNSAEHPNDDSWSGWPWNAPDEGPVAYSINPHFGGITLNWGNPWGDNEEGVDPIDAGYVDGIVVVDEIAQTWSIEMAIYGEQIQLGNQIRFNVGGAASNEEMCAPIGPIGECTYAWFAWSATSVPAAGGQIKRTLESYGTAEFVTAVSTETDPGATGGFAIHATYPNPFSSQTTVVYEIGQSADVQLAVYDVLGRQVQLLDSGLRTAGEHRVAVSGSDLASGLYIVRLSVDGQPVATRTMMRID